MAMTRREVLTIMSSLVVSETFARHTNKVKQTVNDNKLPNGVITAVLTPLDNHLNADFSVKQRLPLLITRQAGCDNKNNKQERITEMIFHIGLY